MILGFVMIVVGIALAFYWTQEFLFALKGALVLGLLFVGLVNVIIGISHRKAHREFEAARHDETGDAVQATETGS